jgi:non-heme chloroperoxidase
MTFINTKDMQIYLKDWGQGNLVVLIHGWPLSTDSWYDGAPHGLFATHKELVRD